MRFLLKLPESDWKHLETRFPDRKDILEIIINEAERLKRKNPLPEKQKMLIIDFEIPEENVDVLIRHAEAEGTTVAHYIKKEIIYPLL